MGHRTLNMLQRYTHLDVQITKKFSKNISEQILQGDLIQDLGLLIDQAKNTVAVAINSTMTALYWRIGYRIHSEILKEKRADYGKEIVASLSRQLTLEYGGGFAEKYLRKMIQLVRFDKAMDEKKKPFKLPQSPQIAQRLASLCKLLLLPFSLRRSNDSARMLFIFKLL